MNVYDVLHLLQNQKNLDKVDKILGEWCFNTSFISPEVLAEVKKQLPKLHEIGEIRIYEYVKSTYNVKM
jgi:hypothetical protein